MSYSSPDMRFTVHFFLRNHRAGCLKPWRGIRVMAVDSGATGEVAWPTELAGGP
jgi:hypothetical protein